MTKERIEKELTKVRQQIVQLQAKEKDLAEQKQMPQAQVTLLPCPALKTSTSVKQSVLQTALNLFLS